MPPSQLPSRRVRLAAVHFENDDTQPVLRLRPAMPGPRVPQEASAAV
jgi:hypothetical protein